MVYSKRRTGVILDRLREHIDPRCELNHKNPFQLLVAVILSAQATDVSVNRVSERLFAKHPDARALLELGERGLLSYIRSIGLAPTKSRNIIKACEILEKRHQGRVPATREELQALPGVGRKTANVVLNVAFGKPVIAVDTHVFRVANRIGIGPGKTPFEVEQNLYKAVPQRHLTVVHHLLILHGRYTCRARNPRCADCPIESQCGYFQAQKRSP